MTEAGLRDIAKGWSETIIPFLAKINKADDGAENFVTANAKGYPVEIRGFLDDVQAVHLPLHDSKYLHIFLDIKVEGRHKDTSAIWVGYIWVKCQETKMAVFHRINTNTNLHAYFGLIKLCRHLWPEEL